MTTRAIEVRVIGDAAQLEQTLGSAATSVKAFGGDVVKAANESVAAAARQRQELAGLAAEYQAIAEQAAKGSDVQIVAAQKAAAAQRELATATAKTGAVSEESAAGISKATSGAVAFTKNILGFTAAFAGFEGTKQSIDVVLAAQTSIEHLDQAIRDAHASVQALTPVLDDYTHKAATLGFTNEQTRQAEAELVTAFGATKKSLSDLSVAEDLARAKNEDLATAAQQLILLQEGNTKAAKQFGLALPDLTKAQWDAAASQDGLTVAQEKGKTLYDELLPRIKDQAQAFANSPSGKIAEFHAEITQLEEGIGDGLLPQMDHYLTSADTWLAKSDNQKRVTEDVQKAVHDLAAALHDAEQAIQTVLPYVDDVAHGLGGWKTVIEALIGLKFATMVGAWEMSLTALIGGETAGLLGAEAAAGGLATKLKLLGSFSGMVVTAAVIESVIANPGQTNKYDTWSMSGLEHGFGLFSGSTWSNLLGSKNNFGTQTGLPNVPATGTVPGLYGPYGPVAAAAAQKYGVPVDQFLRQINQESGFQTGVVSKAGAAGIAQFMPDTAAGFGINPMDPNQALPAAAKMMSQLYAKYHSWGLALAAYNAGEGTVDAYLAGAGGLPKETQSYVQSILGHGLTSSGGGSAWGPAVQSGGGGSADAANVKKPTTITGANLLPQPLRDAIDMTKNKATETQGSVSADWMKKELADLEAAQKELKTELDAAKAKGDTKEVAAIKQETRSIGDQIATVNKGITTNLKAQAAAIKASFSQTLSTEKSAISSAVSQLKSDLDKQFEQATQDYIDNVLGPEFFQGTDANGAPLQTAAEAQLAGMQAQDQLQSLQDAITTASTPADAQAAQRALDEYNLQIEATKERQQADHDYAAAVKQYQDQRSQMEAQLNTQLDQWGKGLADGTSKLTDLNGIAASFGVELAGLTDPTTGIGFDFSNLSQAVNALASTMLTEAALLAGLGDGKDAQKIAATATQIRTVAAASPGVGGVTRPIPGVAIPMADGGSGTVYGPTLFVAGEAGTEDFAFSGGGRSFQSTPPVSVTVERVYALDRSPGVAREIAKAIEPHLTRIVKV